MEKQEDQADGQRNEKWNPQDHRSADDLGQDHLGPGDAVGQHQLEGSVLLLPRDRVIGKDESGQAHQYPQDEGQVDEGKKDREGIVAESVQPGCGRKAKDEGLERQGRLAGRDHAAQAVEMGVLSQIILDIGLAPRIFILLADRVVGQDEDRDRDDDQEEGENRHEPEGQEMVADFLKDQGISHGRAPQRAS